MIRPFFDLLRHGRARVRLRARPQIHQSTGCAGLRGPILPKAGAWRDCCAVSRQYEPLWPLKTQRTRISRKNRDGGRCDEDHESIDLCCCHRAGREPVRSSCHPTPSRMRQAVSTRRSKELYRAGKYAAALPLAQRLLAIREKEFGPDDAMVAMPLNDLGTIHYNLGQYAVAEPLYKRSLAIREKTLGPDHAEVASVLNNLGDLYRAVGRFAEAEPLLKRSIAIREKTVGPDDPDNVLALSNLAALYSQSGPIRSGRAAVQARAGRSSEGARSERSRRPRF